MTGCRLISGKRFRCVVLPPRGITMSGIKKPTSGPRPSSCLTPLMETLGQLIRMPMARKWWGFIAFYDECFYVGALSITGPIWVKLMLLHPFISSETIGHGALLIDILQVFLDSSSILSLFSRRAILVPSAVWPSWTVGSEREGTTGFHRLSRPGDSGDENGDARLVIQHDQSLGTSQIRKEHSHVIFKWLKLSIFKAKRWVRINLMCILIKFK